MRNNAEYLANDAASRVHKAWCDSELRAYYGRLKTELEAGKDLRAALESACMKKGVRRNYAYIFGDKVKIASEEDFMKAVKKGTIKICRFTKRNVTSKEQEKLTRSGDYLIQSQEENILKDFNGLSYASRAENLLAAQVAVDIFERLARNGISVEAMRNDIANSSQYIGSLIHVSWMQRNNPTPSNAGLFCPYDQLGDWEKEQDLTVFAAVLDAVEAKRYVVDMDGPTYLPSYAHIKHMEIEISEAKVPTDNN